MKTNKSFPNFFIVGTARGGTTSLYYILKSHPKIFMSPIKEPAYFTNEFGSEEWSEWENYVDLFKEVKNESIIGEASTVYLYSTDSAKNISNFITKPKILIQLRDPIERAKSHYRLMRRIGKENLSFVEALDREQERIKAGEEPGLHYLNLGFYYPQVKRFFKNFNREDIMITTLDEFKNNPQKILEDICCFLDVEKKHIPKKIPKYNKGNVAKIKWLNSYLKKDTLIKRIFKLITPKLIRKKIGHKIFWDWNVKSSKKNNIEISKEKENNLRRNYVEDINKLQKLINYDLSSWLPKE